MTETRIHIVFKNELHLSVDAKEDHEVDALGFEDSTGNAGCQDKASKKLALEMSSILVSEVSGLHITTENLESGVPSEV